MQSLAVVIGIIVLVLLGVVIARKQERCSRLRKLWYDHVMWTHKYVLAAVHNLPDKSQVAARLLANQAELASATLREPEAAHLKTLLEDHINIAVQIVSALIGGNQEPPQLKAWQTNADDIANYLAQNGIGNREANKHMMDMHLELLTKEVLAIIARNPSDEIKYLDASIEEALEMANSMC